jgi:type VI secretion system protein ImpH
MPSANDDITLDFLDLMRDFERASSNKPRIGESASLAEEIVSLGQKPHIDFSHKNVEEIEVRPDGRRRVTSRFLGMLGPQGALPLHTTYEATHWENMRDPAFARFLDIFNNRFIQLFYRAWANAKPIAQADRPAENQFATYVGAAIGIATPAMRNRDSLADYTKFALAGLLSPTTKSAARVENMLAWLFKAKVEVHQFIGTWLPLDRKEQVALGKANCMLGSDTLIGEQSFSVNDKFRIRIEAADLEEFESFLPSGKYYQLLADAVQFYAGEALIYDVEIGIAQSKTRTAKLGSFGRLGWTTWMKKPGIDKAATTRWDCRFHPQSMHHPHEGT